MTVAELIEKLQTLDQTLPVYADRDGDLYKVGISCYDDDDGPDAPRFVVIYAK